MAEMNNIQIQQSIYHDCPLEIRNKALARCWLVGNSGYHEWPLYAGHCLFLVLSMSQHYFVKTYVVLTIALRKNLMPPTTEVFLQSILGPSIVRISARNEKRSPNHFHV
jgi:hypothetical protein